MIQRVQSLYLVGVIILCVLVYFFPLAVYSTPENFINLFIYNVEEISTSSIFLMYIIIILNISIFILSIITLFKYKNRILQMRLTAFTFLFNALMLGAAFWLTDRIAAEYNTPTHYKIGSLFPLLIVILLFLTNRAIKKDEAKVRAADRLR